PALGVCGEHDPERTRDVHVVYLDTSHLPATNVRESVVELLPSPPFSSSVTTAWSPVISTAPTVGLAGDVIFSISSSFLPSAPSRSLRMSGITAALSAATLPLCAAALKASAALAAGESVSAFFSA